MQDSGILLQGIYASLSVLAVHRYVLIVPTAVTLMMEYTSVHVTLDILAQAVSWWTGVLISHASTVVHVCLTLLPVTTHVTACLASSV